LLTLRRLTIEGGFDFYDEVSRFEIDLLARAAPDWGSSGSCRETIELESDYAEFEDQTYNINPAVSPTSIR